MNYPVYRKVNNPEYVPSLIPCSRDKMLCQTTVLLFSHYTAQNYALKCCVKLQSYSLVTTPHKTMHYI
jgi:hypothetical protein